MKKIRPIYKHQTFTNTTLKYGTVDGFTENLSLIGNEIENIVNDEKKTFSGDAQNMKIKIDTSKIPSGSSEWTIFLNVTENTSPQGEFDRLKVVVGHFGGQGGGNMSNDMTLSQGTGKMVFNTTLNNNMSPENLKTTTLYFWYGGTQKRITVKDVMMVKGTFRSWIEYFEGSKKLGPEIHLLSHNKNIAYKSDLNYDIFLTEQINQKVPGLYTTSFIKKLEQGIDYNFSFDFDIEQNIYNGSGSARDYEKRVVYGLYTEYPKPGDQPIISVIEANPISERRNGKNQKISFHFNSQHANYLMVYLGYIATNKLKDQNMKVDNYVIKNMQLETGSKISSYVKPELYDKKIILPREMGQDDILIYDKDYNKLVIKKVKSTTPDLKLGETTDLTNYYDIEMKTYNDATWFTVIDPWHKGKTILGSVSFDYPSDPEYGHTHHDKFYILKSGDLIDVSLYKTINHVKDKAIEYIEFKDGYYGVPKKYVALSDIIKIIEYK